MVELLSLTEGSIEYKHKTWSSLPKWSLFLMEIGSWLAGVGRDKNIILAISLPLRAYAVAFTAFGLIIELNKSKNFDNKKYFKTLCSLEIGTPVTIIKHGRKMDGFLAEVSELNSKFIKANVIKIQVESEKTGSLTHCVQADDAHTVIPSEKEHLLLPGKQRGREINFNVKFVEAFLGKDVSSKFLTISDYDCILIGTLKTILDEINSTNLRIESDGKKHLGNLHDIIRTRNITGDFGYHSEIIPESKTNLNLTKDIAQAPFAVFDGAKAFLNTADNFSGSQVIILDRTESAYDDAVAKINQLYMTRKISKKPLTFPESIEISEGISIMVFERGGI